MALSSKGERKILGVSGSSVESTYVIDLFLPILSISERQTDVSIKEWYQYMVTTFSLKSTDFDVILGMDILKHFLFFIRGNEYTICY